MPDTAEITLRADLAELAALAAFVDRFAAAEALPSEVAFHLNLVLEELVSNVVAHGSTGGAVPAIRIGLARRGDVVTIDMVDDGAPFDPRSAPAPDLDAPIEERRVGGLGVFLIQQLVDEIDYRRDAHRNHLQLRKRLGPRRASGEAQKG